MLATQTTDLSAFSFPGWRLVGQYDSDVACWLLHHGGEALLLELPEGLDVVDVGRALSALGCRLRYITASHIHPDHLGYAELQSVRRAFPSAIWLSPGCTSRSRIFLAGEPLYIISAPKHSLDDQVVIFRGVAMTGDIELGTLKSVNREVPRAIKEESMLRLRNFCREYGYGVHTVVSAHLNDLRRNVDWESLFTV